MHKRIFMDVESVPPAEEWRLLIKPELVHKLCRRGDVRAPDAEVSAGLCTDEQFRRLALHAEYGRVLSVGIIVEQEGEVVCRGVLGRERETLRFHLDEARTLRGFWNQLKGFDEKRDLIVGHNVYEFDLPFLYKRSVIQRVRPSVRLSFARYRSRPIFDTMKEWELWAWRPGIKLEELAEVLQLGMTKTEGMDGGCVYDRFLEGRHQEIADYCMRDVELTREIYYRLTFEGPTDSTTD